MEGDSDEDMDTDEKGKDHYVFVSGGFAEALPDKVTVLAESAERKRDIDKERAEVALKRAQTRLDQAKRENIDIARVEAALQRAIWRLKLIG